MATQLSNMYKDSLMKGLLDLSTDDIYCALMGAGFIYYPSSHEVYSDISGNELVAADYSAGGALLSNVSVTRDDTNNKAVMTCNSVTWASTTVNIGPCAGAILYKNNSGDLSTDQIIIGYLDFGGNKTAVVGGTFAISGITVEHL